MIISSQEYRDWNIVDEKVNELQGKTSVNVPIQYAGQYAGSSVYIQIDGHHTLEAANELGIKINFVESQANNWDDLTLDEILEAVRS